MPSAEVQLPAARNAPSLARRWLTGILDTWEHDHDHNHDTAMLLVTELVTNAVRHTASSPHLTVTCATGQLRIGVRDGDPTPPTTREPTAYDDAGRGLLLVAALAARWGVEDDPPGKLVWFELANVTPAPPDGVVRA